MITLALTLEIIFQKLKFMTRLAQLTGIFRQQQNKDILRKIWLIHPQ